MAIESRLLQLPLEIRLEIYAQVLQSTTITPSNGRPRLMRGKSSDKVLKAQRSQLEKEREANVSAPVYKIPASAMPLLMVSRQVYAELIFLKWQSHVTYSFPSTLAMLDVLLLGPRKQFELARRMRLEYNGISCDPFGQSHYNKTKESVADQLRLLDGINLDSLEIVDCSLSKDAVRSSNLQRIHLMYEAKRIVQTQGWRELKFDTHSPELKKSTVERLLAGASSVSVDSPERKVTMEFPNTKIVMKECGSKVHEVEKNTTKKQAVGWQPHAHDCDGECHGLATRVIARREPRADVRQMDGDKDVSDDKLGAINRLIRHDGLTWEGLRSSKKWAINDHI